MKTFIYTSALTLLFSTAAISGTASIESMVDPALISPVETVEVFAPRATLEFGFDNNGDAAALVKYHALSWYTTDLSHTLDLTAGFVFDADTASLGVEYNVAYDTQTRWTPYAFASLEYVAPVSNFGNGDLLMTPGVGVLYSINETVSAFTEVSYSFDVSNDFNRMGGVAEVGLNFTVNDNFSVVPSVSRTFDVGAQETTFGLTTVFRF